jgi:hypothetical protein
MRGTLALGIGTILMQLVMKSHRLLTNFTALENGHKKIRLYNKSYYQWSLHKLVIQVVLFHCASAVVTTYKFSNGSSKAEMTLNNKSHPHDW